jgi:hypothetical protein
MGWLPQITSQNSRGRRVTKPKAYDWSETESIPPTVCKLVALQIHLSRTIRHNPNPNFSDKESACIRVYNFAQFAKTLILTLSSHIVKALVRGLPTTGG